MSQPRSRFSHRHLLALSTFLVPLAILGALGWSELQRTGASEQAAIDREAWLFLTSAKRAVEQQLDQQLPRYLKATESMLLDQGALRTTLAMRREEQYAALRDIVMLDEILNVVWPKPPYQSISLPPGRDNPQRTPEMPMHGALQAADLLIEHGKVAQAVPLLETMISRLEGANPPGPDRRPDLEESELNARFRLGACLRKLGDVIGSRKQYEAARQI